MRVIDTIHSLSTPLRGLLVAALSYSVGCVVGAYYLVLLRTGVDVRTTGSGNAGARNAMRSGDTVGGALTFLWDVAKGGFVVWAAARMTTDATAPGIAFLFVVIGHIWPAQLGFRGGRGVAPAIGCTIALAIAARTAPALAAGAIAWALVAFAHQPGFDRHRNALRRATPTRGDGS